MADIISEFHEKYKFRNDKRQRRAISSFLKKVETSGKYPDQDRVKFFSEFRDIREQWLYGDFPMYSDKMGLRRAPYCFTEQGSCCILSKNNSGGKKI